MQPAGPSTLEMLAPVFVIFIVFFFFIIRPQSKKLKEHEKFVSGLKRGDAVVTNSGILGTVEGINEQIVNLEISEGIKMKVLRKQIAGLQAAVLNTGSKK